MSKENVKGFYDFSKDKKEMENELIAAITEDNIVGFAKEKGFEFTKSEHDEFISEVATAVVELTDDQLDKVAGGFHVPGMMQMNVICSKCGWESGWNDINCYTNYGTLTAVHYAVTRHKKYSVQTQMK